MNGEKNPALKGLAGTTARLNPGHDLGWPAAKAVVRADDTGTMNCVDVGAATATVGVRDSSVVATPICINSPGANRLRGINRVAWAAFEVDEGACGAGRGSDMQLLPSHVGNCRRWNANRIAS